MKSVKKFVKVASQEEKKPDKEPPKGAIEIEDTAAQKIIEHFMGPDEGASPAPDGVVEKESPAEHALRQIKDALKEALEDAGDQEGPLGRLSYTELSEELLGEYYEADRELKRWTQIKETLRAEILRLVGKDRGNFQKGQYLLRVHDRGATITFDWRQYVLDEMGHESVVEIENNLSLAREGKQTWKYGKLGKAHVVIDVSEVKKLKEGSENQEGLSAVGRPEAR